MTNPVYDPATGTPVTVTNANPNGQNTKQNSQSVVLTSDQSTPASPLTIEPSIVSAVRQSLSFVVATTTLTSSAAAFQALSLFNPAASGKTITIYRAIGWYGVTITHPVFQMNLQTTDPSIAWTTPVALTPVNLDMGSIATSVAVCKRTNSAQANALAGTFLWLQDVASATDSELIPVGGIRVPAGSGFTVYVNSLSTTTLSISMFYMETTP